MRGTLSLSAEVPEDDVVPLSSPNQVELNILHKVVIPKFLS